MVMNSNSIPYFLTNEDWYEQAADKDEDELRSYVLTDKAPQEAIDSYNAFYADPEPDENGWITLIEY